MNRTMSVWKDKCTIMPVAVWFGRFILFPSFENTSVTLCGTVAGTEQSESFEDKCVECAPLIDGLCSHPLCTVNVVFI